jgi:soluble lytic murein transglycosylase-like protein
MIPEDHHSKVFSPLKDAIVFLVTVAACTGFLAAACTFTKTAEIVPASTALLAIPQPPVPLVWEPEPQSALPEIEVASEAVEVVLETSSAPHDSPVREPIPFHGIIVQVSGRYEVDPHLIRAIIVAESGYNPRAKSKKGAGGLMQLMPSTARDLGVRDIYDPEENIDGGVRYFRSLLDRFDGNVQLALAAYNAGSRHVRNYEGIPPFKATQHYIKKVLKFHEKFKREKATGFRRLA